MPENRVSWEKIEFQGEKIEFWAFWQNRVLLETHKKSLLLLQTYLLLNQELVPKQNLTDAIHKILVIIFGVEDSAVNVLNGGKISGHVDSLMRPRSFRRAAAGRITGKGQIFGMVTKNCSFDFIFLSFLQMNDKQSKKSSQKKINW